MSSPALPQSPDQEATDPQPKLHVISKYIIVNLGLWCGLFLLIGLYLGYQYISERQITLAAKQVELISATQTAAKHIADIVAEVEASADQLAEKLSGGQVNKVQLTDELSTMLKQSDHYFGGSITYKPYAYAPGRALFSAYYA